MKLNEKRIGEIFQTKTKTFIVLEHFENGTTALIQKFFWKKARFDSNSNNFAASEICRDLNKSYYKELADEIGIENIVKHKVDLTMDTGHKDYGTVDEYVSLLTADNFRKYVEILDKYNPYKWWWLATADSRYYSNCVRYVNNNGTLNYINCYGICGGVRPFLIVKSIIEESI